MTTEAEVLETAIGNVRHSSVTSIYERISHFAFLQVPAKSEHHAGAIAVGGSAVAIGSVIVAKHDKEEKQAEAEEIVTIQPVASEVDAKAVLAVVEQTRQESVSWYTRLIIRIKEIIATGGEDTNDKIDAAVAEAKEELTFVLEKSKLEGKADVAKVDVALVPVKVSLEKQLNAIKLSTQTKDDSKIIAVCDAGHQDIDASFKHATQVITVPKKSGKCKPSSFLNFMD